MENIRYFQKGKRAVAELLFPPRCVICDEIQPISGKGESGLVGNYVCGKCRSYLAYTGTQVCQKCGKPLFNERVEYCPDCRKRPHAFTQGKGIWRYQGVMQKSLYRFKYSNRRTYADFYGMEAARLYGSWIRACKIEAIVPIPLHPKKYRQRGYNQAELFARVLGRQMEIPIRTDLLQRIVYTNPQKELDRAERRKNLKKALKVSENDVKLNYILLVDDIYTTGSTMDAAAEEFLARGAKRIYFLTIGMGEGY